MKKYAIIGASGLIGSRLSSELASSSKVYAFSRTPLEFNNQNLDWVECNLESESCVNSIPKNVDSIIYLAQSQYFRDFPRRALDVFDVNVRRYLETLDFALKNNIKHVIYASSGGVYAHQNEHCKEEDHMGLSGELSFYLGSKICAEVASSAFTKHINLQILRFFFVYGEGQKESMLIPRLINNISQGITIDLEGENGVVINPLYVTDAVSAIRALINTRNSEIYNAAGDCEYNLRSICNIIGSIVGRTPVFNIKDPSNKRICGNIQKLKNIGWSPRVSLTEGIRNIIRSKK